MRAGHKVQVVCIFKGRQMAHPEHGFDVMKKVAEGLADVSKVEVPAKMMGRRMTMLLTPVGASQQKKGASTTPKRAPKPGRDGKPPQRPRCSRPMTSWTTNCSMMTTSMTISTSMMRTKTRTRTKAATNRRAPGTGEAKGLPGRILGRPVWAAGGGARGLEWPRTGFQGASGGPDPGNLRSGPLLAGYVPVKFGILAGLPPVQGGRGF
ncbi:MAG: translation initiation factor IF-3 C-terminal domain-containing protein [Planctomycetota bacterium]